MSTESDAYVTLASCETLRMLECMCVCMFVYAQSILKPIAQVPSASPLHQMAGQENQSFTKQRSVDSQHEPGGMYLFKRVAGNMK